MDHDLGFTLFTLKDRSKIERHCKNIKIRSDISFWPLVYLPIQSQLENFSRTFVPLRFTAGLKNHKVNSNNFLLFRAAGKGYEAEAFYPNTKFVFKVSYSTLIATFVYEIGTCTKIRDTFC